MRPFREVLRRATRAQIEAAKQKAIDHRDACRRAGIAPGPADKVFQEALENEIVAAHIPHAEAQGARFDLFTARNYSHQYGTRD
jgi:hypothetical protein